MIFGPEMFVWVNDCLPLSLIFNLGTSLPKWYHAGQNDLPIVLGSLLNNSTTTTNNKERFYRTLYSLDSLRIVQIETFKNNEPLHIDFFLYFISWIEG